MKMQDRLKKIEAANLPALRLADVKSFGEEQGEFLASLLCDLAERGATLPACDELRAMGERHSATMAAKTDAEIEADCGAESESSQWPEGYIVGCFPMDTGTLATAWRRGATIGRVGRRSRRIHRQEQNRNPRDVKPRV
jgi:hypothetical protein